MTTDTYISTNRFAENIREILVAGLLGLGLSTALASSAEAESLTIATSSAINTLDPTQAQIITTDVSLASHLYSSLVARSADGKLTGVLAESWEAEGDSTWVFTLKQGVTFPGGEALDASVVKWNIDRIRDPATNSRNRSWFDQVTDVEVVSPTVVKIHTNGPYMTLPDQLAMLFFLEPEWMKTHDPANEAYGTGAYALKQFTPGDRVVLVPNDRATVEKATFEEVTLRVVPEASARVAGILSGELDLAFNLPLPDVERIEQSGRAHASWTPSTTAMDVKFNNLKAPFAGNLKLRQALNYAIDKQGIVDSLLGGLGTVSQCQLLTPDYYGFNPDLQAYPYDPEKAKQLLAEAGVPTPFKMDLEVPLNRYFMASDIAQVVAAQLQEVGVEVTLKEIEFSAWVKSYAAKEMGDASLIGQNWSTINADGVLGLYDVSNRTAYYDDKEFGDLLKAARAAVDPEERLEAYKETVAHMCEQAPVIFLFTQPLTYATSKKVTWQARGDDWVRAADVTIN